LLVILQTRLKFVLTKTWDIMTENQISENLKYVHEIITFLSAAKTENVSSIFAFES